MSGWRRVAAVALLCLTAPASSLAQQIMPITELNDLLKGEEIIGLRSIPSESMLPTFVIGDRVAVGKMDLPARGDVVIFNHPHSERVMVSRVIGLAGDTIEIKKGLLYLNGAAVPREKLRTLTYYSDDGARRQTATEYRETLPASAGGIQKVHLIHEFSEAESLDETPIFKVPPGHIFLMGDNRDNAEDSRAPSGHRTMHKGFPEAWPYRSPYLPADTRDDAIGFVPLENLIGRAVAVVYSLNVCKLSAEQTAAGVTCIAPRIGQRP
jgi:signal peptidase I